MDNFLNNVRTAIGTHPILAVAIAAVIGHIL
jgi:hypothetical protein